MPWWTAGPALRGEEHRAAVVHCLDEGVVEAVPLWNTWGPVPAARELIARSQAGDLYIDALESRIRPGGA
ncbi:hypothetical protein ACFWQK_12110 [Brachybacterium paraconglomeratum]